MSKKISKRGQEILEKWRENMKRPRELNPEYEAFLEVERKEIDKILESLDEPL